ncbi:TolC family protein [Coraliomargarita akajimensis]|uniref:Outer membrane protein-like protein n=1 Tax=Coraliomargarita akajimensis (strain DSM 45221 / IAM 15411 / JCM 23193 / KCTC 12865 / 04OKA010-24) TaxID=583355 RepID=D5EP88_CORAD|nr:TolC family protein [Coraliomargarita akajimensis]ADE55598.1 Outer membrane protein-like protein [Coraliomargarita akajimensis DSM 45221]
MRHSCYSTVYLALLFSAVSVSHLSAQTPPATEAPAEADVDSAAEAPLESSVAPSSDAGFEESTRPLSESGEPLSGDLLETYGVTVEEELDPVLFQYTPYYGADVESFSRWSYANDPEIDSRIRSVMNVSRLLIDVTLEESIENPEAVGHYAIGFTPNANSIWWEETVREPVGLGKPVFVGLQDLYRHSLKHSTQVQVLTDIPLIRETLIDSVEGQFDFRAFAQSVYTDTNDPVGSLLDTGNTNTVFDEEEWRNEIGVRKRLRTGAEISVSEEFGWVQNNSDFLEPNAQARSRLKLRVSQPLLNGAGVGYNTAATDLSRLDAKSSYYEMLRQVEGHMLEVARAYWGLYFTRISYVRKQEFYERTEEVSKRLRARDDIDALAGQIARVDSALSFRASELQRAKTDIRNAQDRVHSLVGYSTPAFAQHDEIVPRDSVLAAELKDPYKVAAYNALMRRPEIRQSILQVRSSAVRAKVSKNQLLPNLELFIEGYFAGLDGGQSSMDAIRSQTTERTSGIFGLSFEMPLGNRTAKADNLRRKIELRQQMNQLKSTVESVFLEVRIAHREMQTAWSDFSTKWNALQAARVDLEQLEAREDIDTSSSRPTSSFLDEWLRTLTRVEFAESEFIRAAALYQVSWVNYRRVQGSLLTHELIDFEKKTWPDSKKVLPELIVRKHAEDEVAD